MLVAYPDYAFDTTTSLEWLDTSPTSGLPLDDVLAAITNTGWRLATVEQFVDLVTDNIGPFNQPQPLDGFYQGAATSYFASAVNVVMALGPNSAFNYPSPDDTVDPSGFTEVIVQAYLDNGFANILAVIQDGSDVYWPADWPARPLGAYGYIDGLFGHDPSIGYADMASLLVCDPSQFSCNIPQFGAGSGPTPLPTPVPEPATWAMLFLGFMSLKGISRQRSRRRHTVTAP